MASIARIWASVAVPLPPMPAGSRPWPGSPSTFIRAGMCPTETPKLTICPAVAGGVPRGHVAGADLELEGRGDAVAHHHPVALLLLPVLVEVDEARRHHVVGGVDDARAR